MVGFGDIFKKSFLQSTEAGLSVQGIILSLGVSCILAIYLFFVYRVLTRKAFYNRSFNVSLAALSIITTAIILSIQSSMVISLGMVGALSIVRFRTAIKEPMDLVFLFWSISIGIICGAGLYDLAVIASLLITLMLVGLDRVHPVKIPMMVVLDSSRIDAEEDILEVVSSYSSHAKVKSRNMSQDNLNMVIEVKVKEEAAFIMDLNKVEGMRFVSLVTQEGDVTF